MVTGIFIVPIADPQRAIRSDLFADWPEPTVAGGQEIVIGLGFEAGTVGRKPVHVDGRLMNVPHEHRAGIVSRELISLINANAAIGSHVMFVLHDRRQQFIGIRVGRLAALPGVNATRRHVKQMVDHTGTDERIAARIEIHAPRVARAVGENLEFSRAWLITSHGCGNLHAGRRSLGDPYFRMSEHTVSQIHPTVRPPGEAIQQLVPIIEAKSREHCLSRVRDIVMICILEKQQVGCLANIDAAIAKQQSRGEIEAVGENCHLVRAAIVVCILEDSDSVARLGASRCAERIFIQFEDPQAAALVPGHGDRVDNIRFGGK